MEDECLFYYGLFVDFVVHECKLFVDTSSLHLVNQFLNLYLCLMGEIRHSGEEGHEQISLGQAR